MRLPLPNDLAAIAPRYYLLQEIHTKFTSQLGLDTDKVVYGDFGFINEHHRGQKLTGPLDKVSIGKLQERGYTGLISETSNPYLIAFIKQAGFRILEDVQVADFKLGGARPFTKDVALSAFYRPLVPEPKL